MLDFNCSTYVSYFLYYINVCTSKSNANTHLKILFLNIEQLPLIIERENPSRSKTRVKIMFLVMHGT